MTTLTPAGTEAATSRRALRTMCLMNCHPTYCGMIVEIECL